MYLFSATFYSWSIVVNYLVWVFIFHNQVELFLTCLGCFLVFVIFCICFIGCLFRIFWTFSFKARTRFQMIIKEYRPCLQMKVMEYKGTYRGYYWSPRLYLKRSISEGSPLCNVTGTFVIFGKHRVDKFTDWGCYYWARCKIGLLWKELSDYYGIIDYRGNRAYLEHSYLCLWVFGWIYFQ